MCLLAQAIPDISSVPDVFVKNWWIMAGFAIALALLAYNTWLTKQNKSREISGSIETRPGKEHADQADLDDLKKSVDAMRQEITAQFRAAQQAGEARVSAITQNIDEEMRTLAVNVGRLTDMITKALVDNASQGEAINGLKASTNSHQNSITAIHRRIDELIALGKKRTA